MRKARLANLQKPQARPSTRFAALLAGQQCRREVQAAWRSQIQPADRCEQADGPPRCRRRRRSGGGSTARRRCLPVEVQPSQLSLPLHTDLYTPQQAAASPPTAPEAVQTNRRLSSPNPCPPSALTPLALAQHAPASDRCGAGSSGASRRLPPLRSPPPLASSRSVAHCTAHPPRLADTHPTTVPGSIHHG